MINIFVKKKSVKHVFELHFFVCSVLLIKGLGFCPKNKLLVMFFLFNHVKKFIYEEVQYTELLAMNACLEFFRKSDMFNMYIFKYVIHDMIAGLYLS